MDINTLKAAPARAGRTLGVSRLKKLAHIFAQLTNAMSASKSAKGTNSNSTQDYRPQRYVVGLIERRAYRAGRGGTSDRGPDGLRSAARATRPPRRAPQRPSAMHSQNFDDLDRVLWGAQAIGEEVGLKPHEAYYQLRLRRLPADKVGTQWVSTPRRLRAHFSGQSVA